ncbi:MAG: hypothetical protein AB7V60_03570, partial [Candidatus Caldatribacteriota bacterium]
ATGSTQIILSAPLAMTFYFVSLSYSIEIAWQLVYSGEVSPETPQRKYNSRKYYLVLQTRYSRGRIPLLRGVSRRDGVFLLRALLFPVQSYYSH